MIMTEQMFEDYENGFNNSSDKNDFFDRWYDSDAEFVHPIKEHSRAKNRCSVSGIAARIQDMPAYMRLST